MIGRKYHILILQEFLLQNEGTLYVLQQLREMSSVIFENAKDLARLSVVVAADWILVLLF